MKKIVSCILIVLTAVVLVACGTSVKDQEKNLVGVWSGESGTLTLYDKLLTKAQILLWKLCLVTCHELRICAPT